MYKCTKKYIRMKKYINMKNEAGKKRYLNSEERSFTFHRSTYPLTRFFVKHDEYTRNKWHRADMYRHFFFFLFDLSSIRISFGASSCLREIISCPAANNINLNRAEKEATLVSPFPPGGSREIFGGGKGIN